MHGLSVITSNSPPLCDFEQDIFPPESFRFLNWNERIRVSHRLVPKDSES